MRSIIAGLGLLLGLLCASVAWADEAQPIVPGDKLSVLVYGEPEMSITDVKVLEDGSIVFPLLGEVKVGGLTPLQLKQKLAQLLADGYLKRPEVAVTVDAVARQYFVSGAVNKPGAYVFSEGLSVQKALVIAGGLSERASKSKITLIRAPAPEPSPARLDDTLKPGDILTVGESFF